jgi:hypothetical protein
MTAPYMTEGAKNLASHWRDVPVNSFYWTAPNHKLVVKTLPSVDLPVVHEKHQDGAVTVRTFKNTSDRIVAYGFTFEPTMNDTGPFITQYEYSLAVSYAASADPENTMTVVMGSPHIRLLRCGGDPAMSVYHIVIRKQ